MRSSAALTVAALSALPKPNNVDTASAIGTMRITSRILEHNVTDDEEGVEIHLIHFGWRDRLPQFSRPVIALFEDDLWMVKLEGCGFRIPSATDASHGLSGFFTTIVVAAPAARVAEEKSKRLVASRWRKSAPGRLAIGELTLAVVERHLIDGWFRWSSGSGYSFY